MNSVDVDKEVKKALSVWSDFTDLTFTQRKSGRVHIDISFLEGEHGDGDPFDGSGGTLAHAFFPVLVEMPILMIVNSGPKILSEVNK